MRFWKALRGFFRKGSVMDEDQTAFADPTTAPVVITSTDHSIDAVIVSGRGLTTTHTPIDESGYFLSPGVEIAADIPPTGTRTTTPDSAILAGYRSGGARLKIAAIHDTESTLSDSTPDFPTPGIGDNSRGLVPRTIAAISDDYEAAVTRLEMLNDTSDAYYQQWLLDNEQSLRARAMRDRRSVMDLAAQAVTRLDSELTNAITQLGRRAATIRQKVLQG